jgi:hypothetical protein
VTVFDRPLEDGEQAGVFGEIVGLAAQELAESSNDAALGVFYDEGVSKRLPFMCF